MASQVAASRRCWNHITEFRDKIIRAFKRYKEKDYPGTNPDTTFALGPSPAPGEKGRGPWQYPFTPKGPVGHLLMELHRMWNYALLRGRRTTTAHDRTSEPSTNFDHPRCEASSTNNCKTAAPGSAAVSLHIKKKHVPGWTIP